MVTKRPIVFVSCGQSSEQEKNLGLCVADMVTEITPFQGYFAQNQSSLEGVAEHILGAINRCVGLIAIMHDRGEVTAFDRHFNRGSVWIEQEIAIAAFLKLIQRKSLEVLLYTKRGIALEGLREKLMLNPRPFEDGDDILEDLRSVLPSWKLNLGAGFADSSFEGKIRGSLDHCQRINVTVNVVNESDFEIVVKRIEIRGESGLITEAYEPPESQASIGPRRPWNLFHWVAVTPPAATLVHWNSNEGLFFNADIEIVVECEILGTLRRIPPEKKKVRVSVTNLELKQLGP